MDLLGEGVASIRAQTFRDWELIVIDDGSADASAGIVEAEATCDSRACFTLAGATNIRLLRVAALATNKVIHTLWVFDGQWHTVSR